MFPNYRFYTYTWHFQGDSIFTGTWVHKKTYFHFFSPAADIDECAEGLASCGAHAQCLNLPGSHRCRCQSGFEFAFDGRTCVGKFHRATFGVSHVAEVKINHTSMENLRINWKFIRRCTDCVSGIFVDEVVSSNVTNSTLIIGVALSLWRLI